MGLFSLEKLFGITIRESATDGSDFTNPDADYRRLFLGEDGQLHVKDSAGAVTDIGVAAAFHGCSVYRNTTETSTTVLAFNAELYDSDGYHESVTNPSRITIPTGLDGKYLFEFGTSSSFAASSANGIRLRKNGTTAVSLNWWVDAQSYIRGTQVLELAAADYIECHNFTAASVSFGHASAYEAQEHLTATFLGA